MALVPNPYLNLRYTPSDDNCSLTILPIPTNCEAPSKLGRPRRNVFQRHSNLSVAIANYDDDQVDAILQDYYVSLRLNYIFSIIFCVLSILDMLIHYEPIIRLIQ